MSYTPTNWQTGDTITAEKLNKLEVGVADASNLFGEASDTRENVYILTADDGVYHGTAVVCKTIGSLGMIVTTPDGFTALNNYSMYKDVIAQPYTESGRTTIAEATECRILMSMDSQIEALLFPQTVEFIQQ